MTTELLSHAIEEVEPHPLTAPAVVKALAGMRALKCVLDEPPPDGMQGQIFLGERAGKERKHVFGARDRCDMTVMRIRAVADEHYRYIRNFTPDTPFLAYYAYKEKQYPVWTLLPKLHKEGKLPPEQA